ncbi:MAG: tRNA (adenosine(37)-N6)-threonylcarbamoyltransferase complex ATPase subunit type 1 TsaE [Deltaproteobacteria bacterium]|nr:tRNA (adenosine(37)-N6)-threonylcarbamoyltransferase complex ATPase subunit type 1 TsaE [Deltaproteobacteria bacterium]
MDIQIHTASPEETEAWGERLAQVLQPGTILGLTGELGAGKTCFVRGLATGLGVNPEAVHSPTFTLIAEHGGGRIPLYHIDLYRLEGAAIEELGLEEYLFGAGVSAIEWFRFLPSDRMPEYLLVTIAFGAGEEERVLTFFAQGEQYEHILRALLNRVPPLA